MGDQATRESELETWVRAELHLPAEATVQIAEKPGNDPRCSDTVTEVTVATPDDEPWTFHIEQSLAALVPMDLVAALAFGGGH